MFILTKLKGNRTNHEIEENFKKRHLLWLNLKSTLNAEVQTVSEFAASKLLEESWITC